MRSILGADQQVKSIFGVDPGLHVGLLCVPLSTFRVEMLTLPPVEAAYWVEDRLEPGDVLATERFTASAGSARYTRQNDALEVVGMMRLLAHKYAATFVLQTVSDAVKVAPADVIKALGWWRRGDPDHVRRAAAQAAYALFRLRPEEFENRTRPGVVM